MRRTTKRKKIIRRVIPVLFILILIWNVGEAGSGGGESAFSFAAVLTETLQQKVTETILPFAAYQTREKQQTAENFAAAGMFGQPYFFSYAMSHGNQVIITEDGYFYEMLLQEQGKRAEAEREEGTGDGNRKGQEESAETKKEEAAEGDDTGEDTEEAMAQILAAMEAENQRAAEQIGQETEEEEQEAPEQVQEEAEEAANLPQTALGGFPKVLEKQKVYDWNNYRDFESLIEEFYAVDSTTRASAEQINLQNFLDKDLSIDKNTQGYQILVFHTHSQESFVNSVAGDNSTTIVGAGERLTQILTEEYGYKVLHHTGEYDVEYRDQAYSKALPAIEQVLAENPEIQVVIDLHRDEVAEGTKLVTDIGGRPTAKFMFFNGLSYTNQTGEIGYLINDNLPANLAFSFQMQAACNEYYPGLTRRIYLKGYRYNMHLKERFLLVELGAQTNTIEEAKNACDPLAQVLDMVLSGMVY